MVLKWYMIWIFYMNQGILGVICDGKWICIIMSNAIDNGKGRRIALSNDGATLNFTFPTDGSNRCW